MFGALQLELTQKDTVIAELEENIGRMSGELEQLTTVIAMSE
jgi:hypothetical protein